jgi:3-oxoacyl-[acyl-carrier protein] reductase
MRSLAKEVGGRGATANLAYLAPGAADRLAGPVDFFCGSASTYVSGQAVHIDGRVARPQAHSMRGQLALVTGAARGIGAATAARLVREGALVHALDVPAAAEALAETCARIGARPVQLDMAADSAAAALAAQFPDGIDIITPVSRATARWER